MYIAEMYKADVGNGTGMRVSLFVSGCTLHCKGCFNEKAWDFTYGQLWTPELQESLIKELSRPFYQGLTILGGEPFELETQPDIAELIRKVRTVLPDRDIWMFSGNQYDKNLIEGGSRYIPITTDYILDNIDILVDGPFVQEKHDVRLNFRGSSNQRIIDMRATRAAGQVVLHPLNNII